MALLRSADLYTVVCRPALPKDTADVMELTSRIWEGHDYVPHYWQTWLEDSAGLLAVAEYARRVIGLSKLSRVGEHEWWIQGLRVDPLHQGRGIASHLHDYLLAYWERHCSGVLRLATSSARLPVHHLCERTGFQRVGDYMSFVAEALEPGAEAFSPIQLEEVDAALDFARRSELFRLSSGLMANDWVWCEPSPSHLIAAIQRGEAHWWKPEGKRGGLLVSAIEDEEDGSLIYIQLSGGEVNRLAEMMVDFRKLAVSQGYSRASWMAPNHAGIYEALAEAGYVRDWEHSLYVYEKRLPA